MKKKFTPDFIIDKHLQKETSGTFESFVLFIDIAGFTAMTEKLMQQGKYGVEELSDILEFLFTTSVKAVYDNGGFIINFAGDAFTALFIPEKDSENEIVGNLLKSVQTISRFFKKNEKYRSNSGEFNFSVKIGLGFGKVSYGIDGQDDYKLYYFKGDAIDKAAEAEHQAVKGEVWFSKDCLPHFKKYLSKTEERDSFYKILSFKRYKTEKRKTKKLSYSKKINEIFSGKNELKFAKGEFRNIVSVFISFDGDYDFSKLIQELIKLVKLYGGSKPKIDFGDKGATVIVFFGTPIAYENYQERALRFILDFNSGMDGKIQFRAGLAEGLVYTGLNGSARRNEFTCLGNTVNQSARFMMKAKWGEILTDQKLAKQAGFKFSYEGNLNYKGREEVIPTYKLEERTTSNIREYNERLIGRKSELEILSQIANLTLTRENLQEIVYIDGPAGIGKSMLLNKFASSRKSEFQHLYLSCEEILKKSFNPFSYLLFNFFDQNDKLSKTTNKGKFETIFTKLKTDVIDEEIVSELNRTKSVLAALIDIDYEDSLYQNLDPKGRFENTKLSLINFFKSQAKMKPIIIEIDDLHSIDSDSKIVLEELISGLKELPVIVLASCRFLNDGSNYKLNLPEDIKETRINLEHLSKEDSKELILDRLKLNKLDSHTVDIITEKSQGNPFYLDQIILYLKELNVFNEEGKLTTENFEFPSNINTIIISRIDKLATNLQEIIKTASVLGKEFATNLLSIVLQKAGNQLLGFDNNMKEGEHQQIWHSLTELSYIFKHTFIREVVYGMQLKKRLQKLHKFVAGSLEEVYAKNIDSKLADIAYHFYEAEEGDKALEYYFRAGKYCRNNYQNQKALDYFNRWLEIAEKKLGVKDRDKDFEKLEITDENRSLVEKYIEVCELDIDFLNRISNSLVNNSSRIELSIKIAEKLGSDFYKGICNLNRGNNFLDENNYNDAESHLNKAKDFFNLKDDNKKLSIIYYTFGVLNWKKGDLKSSIKYFKFSLESSTRIQNSISRKKAEARAYANLANVYDFAGKQKEVLDFYNRALQIQLEIGNKREIQYIYGNLGVFCFLQGDYEKAIELYNKKMIFCKEIGDIKEEAIALSNLGYTYFKLKDYKKADSLYFKSLNIFKRINASENIINTYSNLGQSLRKQKLYSDSRSYFEKALELLKKFSFPFLEAEVKIETAHNYLQKGEYQEALILCNEGLEIAKKIGHAEYLENGKILKEKIEKHLR
ncbi:MAG: tetratricopeptide repeat protein [Candidatus Delongbacteria bacterium]|nr:tetratricopeptide repeat protein [Candidatus Delongbacteria bacterium]MBN2836468.1 tetratricopeptide repeat protein [Candidatus Delongbacteria bacterium]